MYYITKNEKIIFADSNIQKLEDTLKYVSEGETYEIMSCEKDIVEFNGNFYFEDDETLKTLLKEKRKSEIEVELKELDQKRIRAVCEPSLKDENTTWLEFYNDEIKKLREELASL